MSKLHVFHSLLIFCLHAQMFICYLFFPSFLNHVFLLKKTQNLFFFGQLSNVYELVSCLGIFASEGISPPWQS